MVVYMEPLGILVWGIRYRASYVEFVAWVGKNWTRVLGSLTLLCMGTRGISITCSRLIGVHGRS